MEGIDSSSSCSSYIPTFLPGFIFFYLFGYVVVFRNSSPKRRPEDSSCFMSLAHGTPAAIMALLSIMAYPQSGFATVNTSFQNLVLDFSISYFLADLLHYFIFCPSDVLFIGHHLATLFVFITCRYVVTHGAFALLVLLILAEVTSFCQNTWTLANSRRANSHMAAKVYDVLSPFFYSLYTLVRGFAGPVFVYKMGLFFISGEADLVIPRWMWISWMVVIVGAISVSILWILTCGSSCSKREVADQKRRIDGENSFQIGIFERIGCLHSIAIEDFWYSPVHCQLFRNIKACCIY